MGLWMKVQCGETAPTRKESKERNDKCGSVKKRVRRVAEVGSIGTQKWIDFNRHGKNVCKGNAWGWQY